MQPSAKKRRTKEPLKEPFPQGVPSQVASEPLEALLQQVRDFFQLQSQVQQARISQLEQRIAELEALASTQAETAGKALIFTSPRPRIIGETFLDAKETAALLKVHVNTVYLLIRNEENPLPYFYINSLLRFRRGAVIEWAIAQEGHWREQVLNGL